MQHIISKKEYLALKKKAKLLDTLILTIISQGDRDKCIFGGECECCSEEDCKIMIEEMQKITE